MYKVGSLACSICIFEILEEGKDKYGCTHLQIDIASETMQ